MTNRPAINREGLSTFWAIKFNLYVTHLARIQGFTKKINPDTRHKHGNCLARISPFVTTSTQRL